METSISILEQKLHEKYDESRGKSSNLENDPQEKHTVNQTIHAQSRAFMGEKHTQVLGGFIVNHRYIAGWNNNVFLVKIEGPVWYTIYHNLPVVQGVYTPLY